VGKPGVYGDATVRASSTLETITTKRGKPVAPSAIDGMVSYADRLNYHALRAHEEPADGTIGVPRFLVIVSRQRLLGRSKQAVNEAIAVLAGSGVLRPLTLARRNRAWEARELFEPVDDAERELATPDDDESSRPSPRRRR
jgi:hypothetical protein